MTIPILVYCWLTAGQVAGGLSSLEIDAELKKIRDNRVACGPLCCWYCLARFGKTVPSDVVIDRARLGTEGMSAQRLLDLCKSFGLDARAVAGPRDRFSDLPIPAIVFVDDRHCLVYDGQCEKRTYESVRVFEPMTRHVGDEDARKLRELWSGEAIVFGDIRRAANRLYAVTVGAAAITIVAVPLIVGIGRSLIRAFRGAMPARAGSEETP